MFFMIDFDRREVDCKSIDGEVLRQYVLENDLSLAVAIVDSEDELGSQLSDKEMEEVYAKCTGGLPSTDGICEMLWGLLEENQDKFPTFTKALGKKLLKAETKADKEPVNKPADKPVKTAKPKPASSGKTIRASNLVGLTFTTGDKPTRAGTAFHIFTTIIDDNFGQATFDDLVSGFMVAYKPSKTNKPVDEKCAQSYLKDAFKVGVIVEEL